MALVNTARLLSLPQHQIDASSDEGERPAAALVPQEAGEQADQPHSFSLHPSSTFLRKDSP